MRTVRQVTASPVPPGRMIPVREATAGWIDEMLAGDLATPRKQRHTVRRIFERLADERGAQVSYSYADHGGANGPANGEDTRQPGIAAFSWHYPRLQSWLVS